MRNRYPGLGDATAAAEILIDTLDATLTTPGPAAPGLFIVTTGQAGAQLHPVPVDPGRWHRPPS